MRYLIDTNIFVYLMVEPDMLNHDVDALLRDYDNQLYISIESLKELVVAYRNKGLWGNVWRSEEDMVRDIINSNISIIPLKPEHLLTYAKMEINNEQ